MKNDDWIKNSALNKLSHFLLISLDKKFSPILLRAESCNINARKKLFQVVILPHTVTFSFTLNLDLD